MADLHVIDHPIVVSNLTEMRDGATASSLFRKRLRTITHFLAYEATKDLPIAYKEVETPVTTTALPVLSDMPISIVSIVRAGIGMVDGMLDVLPDAGVGFIGMKRDEETLKPNEYYVNLPVDIAKSKVFVVDPMLATGGSAIDAIAKVKAAGATDITMICLLAAPQGVKAMADVYPEIDIYTAALDETLNEKGYIVPGLGDAGDRIFNNL